MCDLKWLTKIGSQISLVIHYCIYSYTSLHVTDNPVSLGEFEFWPVYLQSKILLCCMGKPFSQDFCGVLESLSRWPCVLLQGGNTDCLQDQVWSQSSLPKSVADLCGQIYSEIVTLKMSAVCCMTQVPFSLLLQAMFQVILQVIELVCKVLIGILV